MHIKNWQRAGFGLYVHWPFCQAKCPYCDFNSHVVASIDQERWKNAYLSELERVAVETPKRILDSIFFGGGTPSMMDAGVVDAVIAKAHQLWKVSDKVEITLEANPTSVEASRFAGYANAGVNRVSLGIQALNDPDLKALGRLHSTSEALDALTIARENFNRVSFDLIYARQNQTLPGWNEELKRALSFGPDHLSLYQLTIEDGTAFGDRHAIGKLRGLPDEGLAADMYEVTQELTADAGLPAYEVSNHARPGQASRHNLIYWRGGDYLGIGPGAHGRLTKDGARIATETALSPSVWLQGVESHGSGEVSRSTLSDVERETEYLMMSLRLDEGADLDCVAESLSDQIFSNNIKHLTDMKMLEISNSALKVPPKNRILLNAILGKLLV